MKEEYYANMRGAKVVEVIMVEANEGEGVEGDPVRRVIYLYSKTGELLAKIGDDKDRKFCDGDFMRSESMGL